MYLKGNNEFDKIFTIASYGIEIWFCYKTSYHKRTLDEIFELFLKGNNEFDKIFTGFCKHILAVHYRASNFDVYSALGQFPRTISIISNYINFWLHALSVNTDTLLSKDYLDQFNRDNEKRTWLNFVKNMLSELEFAHVWQNHCTFNKAFFDVSCEKKMKYRVTLFWTKHMNPEQEMKKYELINSFYKNL